MAVAQVDPTQSNLAQTFAEDQSEEHAIAVAAPRTRRAILTAGFAALGAAVAARFATASPAEASTSVTLGGSNSETAPTTIKNSKAAASAKAIVGRTTYAGTTAIQGLADGADAVGVAGAANAGASAAGVFGNAAQGIGVRGNGVHGVFATGSYDGVYASSSGGNGINATGAVYGVAAAGTTAGVNASAPASAGIGVVASGGTTGVQGSGGSYSFYAPAGGAYGFYGSGTTSGGDFFGGPWGVYGVGSNYGVQGIGTATSGTVYGVYGYASSTSATAYGTYGYGGYSGVYGNSTYVGTWGGASTTSPTYGLVGYGTTYGIWATANGSGTTYAVYGAGNAYFSGTVQSGGGYAIADHPADPENKWLTHAFVASPDMLNVYSGTVTLDAHGEVTVKLPGYFGAYNRDFRYQLTPIGGAAPSLHIAQGVKGNRFRIAGGTPGLEVSWQVTGIRQDDFARANPVVVEKRKPRGERGTRQFVPAGSTAKLSNLGPRPAPDDTSGPHQPLHPARR